MHFDLDSKLVQSASGNAAQIASVHLATNVHVVMSLHRVKSEGAVILRRVVAMLFDCFLLSADMCAASTAFPNRRVYACR